MDKKSLTLFIKEKDIHIKQLSSNIVKIKEDIEELKSTIDNIKAENHKLENRNLSHIGDFLHLKGQIFENMNHIKKLHSQIKTLQRSLEEESEKLKRLNSEKRGLEKMYENIEKSEKKSILNRENILANESFLRKYIYS